MSTFANENNEEDFSTVPDDPIVERNNTDIYLNIRGIMLKLTAHAKICLILMLRGKALHQELLRQPRAFA